MTTDEDPKATTEDPEAALEHPKPFGDEHEPKRRGVMASFTAGQVSRKNAVSFRPVNT